MKVYFAPKLSILSDLAITKHTLFKPTISLTAQTSTMSAQTDAEAAEVQSSTGVTPDTLSETLKVKLDASHVDIQDLSGMTNQPQLPFFPGTVG